LIFSFEKTSLVEDVAELGMREKQLDAAALQPVLKVMEVVGMYEKSNMGGRSVLLRTQLDVGQEGEEVFSPPPC
jgi:hypothetical protein